jgi:SAM-dependent methyltransferase
VIHLRALGPLAGHFDEVRVTAGSVEAHGWMLGRDSRLDAMSLFGDGQHLGPVDVQRRPDVARAHPWIEDAASSGFVVAVTDARLPTARLDLVGYREGRPAGRVSTCLPVAADDGSLLPPAPLTERVSGVSGRSFAIHGLQMFTDLGDQIERFAPSSARRVLDWGCGCGRVTRYLLSRRPLPEVFGCDIDEEAVEWCRAHLAPGQFPVVAPTPPTPYADGTFDVVIGCSVFTHLSRSDQRRWLEEIRRILAPGGVLMASTHGEYAFRLARSTGGRAARVRSLFGLRKTRVPQLEGILDQQHDRTLDAVAPPGYYRLTYQSREHTIEEWSQVMEIVGYFECGLLGHQDLVVLRR